MAAASDNTGTSRKPARRALVGGGAALAVTLVTVGTVLVNAALTPASEGPNIGLGLLMAAVQVIGAPLAVMGALRVESAVARRRSSAAHRHQAG